MKPLGISVLRTLFPVGDRSPSGESDLLQEAGCRVFVDLNPVLRYRRLRQLVPRVVLPLADERIARAVPEFLQREEYRAALRPDKRVELSFVLKAAPFLLSVLGTLLFRDLGRSGLDEIERAMAERIAQWRRRVEAASGPEKVKRIRFMLRALFPDLVGMRVLQNVLPGVLSFRLIGSLSQRWLGDAAELASVGRSPRGNVTTELGLALGDVADVVRAHPGAIERLRRATDATLEDDLRELAGGEEVHRAFATFLERYGMRCTGEIDITRPRWREAPTQLSRSLRDGINVLWEWCDKGLRVVSVTQQINFNGTVGKMMAAVLLGIAEMEQETRRERQAAGIAVAKKAGIRSCRDRLTFSITHLWAKRLAGPLPSAYGGGVCRAICRIGTPSCPPFLSCDGRILHFTRDSCVEPAPKVKRRSGAGDAAALWTIPFVPC